MDKYALYRLWAPEAAAWSPWVKPVLFANELPNPVEELPAPRTFDVTWLAPLAVGSALLIDLPGEDAVQFGLAVARTYGFRPVPLFTSAAPEVWQSSIVSTQATRLALWRGADELTTLNLPPLAAPAFLVDARRRAPDVAEVPVNTFDNRSAVFATDLPSAPLLRTRNVRRCVIVRDPNIPLGPDLGYALLQWKRAGFEFDVRDPEGRPVDFAWPSSGFWAQTFHRLHLLLSLKRAAVGGFGVFVSESSGG
jgi:hypothetical protein